MLHLGNVPAGITLYIPFTTYGKTNGESITLTGLAVTDIEIYKNGSTTQRASDNGYALLDTDGIDFDGITGLHGFSIDLSDNSDAGFFSVGGFYWVVVSTVTIDSQTVTFIAATFRIVTAEGVTGQPKVDVAAFGGSAGTFSGGRPEVNTTHLAGSAIDQSGGLINANVKQISGDATAADNLEAATDGTGYNVGNGQVVAASVTGAVGSVTGNVGGNVTGSVGSLAAQAKADVNTEVLDVVNVDTFAEPGQESPAATTTLVKKIGYLYKLLRNKITQDASTLKIFADDGATVDQKASVSDDGTTYTRNELATGP